MALYCSQEHQEQDWARHKKECKELKALGLWGCVFNETKELARFPIGSQCEEACKRTAEPSCPPPRPSGGEEAGGGGGLADELARMGIPDTMGCLAEMASMVEGARADAEGEDDEDDTPEAERKARWEAWERENGLLPGPDDVCGICGTKENLERTECCGNWICNTEADYQMFSYSRKHCIRSHRKYTMCGTHCSESHEGDWRTCEACATFAFEGAGVRSWYTTNGYNFTPGLFAAYSTGSSITDQCSRCQGRIATGFEGYSSSGQGLCCESCQSF